MKCNRRGISCSTPIFLFIVYPVFSLMQCFDFSDVKPFVTFGCVSVNVEFFADRQIKWDNGELVFVRKVFQCRENGR